MGGSRQRRRVEWKEEGSDGGERKKKENEVWKRERERERHLMRIIR
jgi:hypothetical protein